ncbi:hypothetical protein H4Q26_013296 [Puccinia striiformis f. sp. tritici PST-130]|nr:hypothetical protein H4Q26_013296 [Puccinia striiformis f. sp. tritici PST-130]
MRKQRNPFNVKTCYPRMSWNPQNLFNLYQRKVEVEGGDESISRDWIQEKKFKRHYLPASLPALAVKSSLKKSRYGNREEKVPLAALIVYEARRMVIYGAVKLMVSSVPRLGPGSILGRCLQLTQWRSPC